MDPLKELPLGFGMALVQNTAALERFGAMSPEQQQQIVAKTHNINSKSEMKAFVSSIDFEGEKYV